MISDLLTPKVSVCIPIHDMKNGDYFLTRLMNSLIHQTFRDFEVIITKKGKMAENTNAAIKEARGEIIKILYMDDYLVHEDSLKKMVEAFDITGCSWLIAGATNNKTPYWTDDIETGNNKLGSPSSLMIRNYPVRNKNDIYFLFDEKLSWLLDCELYKRLEKKWGKPVILEGSYIGIGIHEGQMTNILTYKEKIDEYEYMGNKYKKP